jgi:serine/threonine-protein kinase RsbW
MRQPLNRPDPDSGQGPAVVSIRIPASPEWVGVARLATAGFASRSGMSIEDIEDLKLAVAEACNCCIQNPGAGDVRIECALDETRITIAVERSGTAARGATHASSTGDASEVGGLGVFIIRALMDDVTYASDQTSGTKLTLTKLLGS